jgi:transcriptional regulator with XRE-family HTH domain
MPFNPFQKFAIDLTGVGWEPAEAAARLAKKNPPLKTFLVSRKKGGEHVSTEAAYSKSGAIRKASKRTGVHPSYLKASVKVPTEVDQSQIGLFGSRPPEVELERERREEASGQSELFNPPRHRRPSAWAYEQAQLLVARNPGMFGDVPPLHGAPEGLGHEGRIELYAQRIEAGLDPFTGLPPTHREGITFPKMAPIRRAPERRRRPLAPPELPPEVLLEQQQELVTDSCDQCRRGRLWAEARGLEPRACRACAASGRAWEPPKRVAMEAIPDSEATALAKQIQAYFKTPLAAAKAFGTTGSKWNDVLAGRSHRSTSMALERRGGVYNTKTKRFINKARAILAQLEAGSATEPAPAAPTWAEDLEFLRNHYSTNDLAGVLGVAKGTVWSWVRGSRRSTPRPGARKKIVDVAAWVRAQAAPPAPRGGGRPHGLQATPRIKEDLHELKARHGTWRAAAGALGVSPAYLSNVKAGRANVTQAFVERLSGLLEGSRPQMQNPQHYPLRRYKDKHDQRAAALDRAREVTSSRMVPVDQALVGALDNLIESWPSQAKLAKFLRISKQQLTNIIKGRRPNVDREFYEAVMRFSRTPASRALPRPRPSSVAGLNPPPGKRVHPELARMMNPDRPRRRNRDAKWKREPETYEITLEEARQLPSFAKALKKYRRFHGTDPKKVMVYRIPDGSREVTREDQVYVALGRRKQTPYTIDDDVDSNKADTLWYHDHPEGKEPLIVLNASTGIVSDVGGSYLVDDWFYS